MTTINPEALPLYKVISGALREAWRKHPLLSLVFVMGFITSLVFWTQLGALAWFGQILLVVVTVSMAFAVGSLLTRAWLDFRLKENLIRLGEQRFVDQPHASRSLHEVLADEIHRLTEQQEFLDRKSVV